MLQGIRLYEQSVILCRYPTHSIYQMMLVPSGVQIVSYHEAYEQCNKLFSLSKSCRFLMRRKSFIKV